MPDMEGQKMSYELIKHSQFLNAVRAYITENPEVAPYATEFIAKGIEASRKVALDRAADFESATMLALTKRPTAKNKAYILDILKKWNGKATFDWGAMISEYEKRIAK